MKSKIASIISIIAMAITLTSCVREQLLSPYPDGEEGERVKVELSFKIPPASTPQQSQSRNVSDHTDFSVGFFNEETSTAKTRSEGATKLHNLWLFQFKPDGNIHGLPQQISDQVNMVNDMALLSATLRVGTNQTLYIVVLGKQATATSDLTQVRTITDLENIQLDYTDNKAGLYYSRITDENEVPYAGSAAGVNIRELDDSGNGEIVYGTPDGFSGGIEVKRLVSRIMLKHKFDLTANTLEGMKLLNVPTKLLINPASVSKDVIESIPMVSLESDNAFGDGNKDADGFFTSQWYVAQNKQGTASGIATERDRYLIVNTNGTTGAGLAPKSGTNIEAWSYSNSSRDKYTVHQIYIGNNNTDNFDVEINNYYNIRTVINSDDLADKRIRSYTAAQKVYLSAVTKTGILNSGIATTGTDGGTNVYFDAHYGWRPMIIQARGRKVTVGIYKDLACTQLINMDDPMENWLQLSSYPNYTEVVRNGGKTALSNQFETNIFVPTRFKLYLYADEYITNPDGSITDYTFDKNTIYKAANSSTATAFLKNDRTLYVKVLTEEINAQGTPQKIGAIYTISQKQGFYTGLFGGDIIDGQYTQGLIIDAVNEHNIRIDDQYPVSSPATNLMYFAYNNIFTNYSWDSTISNEENYKRMVNGKQATFNLATNPNNYTVNTDLTLLSNMRKINGHIDLYQYDYFNTFHARFCHDLNRDKNGNGVIDYIPDSPENELEWYLPSTYQAFGILATAGSIIYDTPLALATERDATSSSGASNNNAGFYTSNSSKTGQSGWKRIRCVRNIPVPKEKKEGTKATTYTTKEGEVYAMIDLTNLPNGTTDKTTAEEIAEMYESLNLYSYSTTGTEYNPDSPVADTSINLNQKVSRIIKNYPLPSSNQEISKQTRVATYSSRKFIVSPTNVYNDGDTESNPTSEILKNANDIPIANNVKMSWAEANGRLNTANTQDAETESQATMTGCYAYRGKNGNDEPGSWRVPNIRELSMILIFAHEFENNNSTTGFTPLEKGRAGSYFGTGYWSSTIGTKTDKDNAVLGSIDVNYSPTINAGNIKKTDKHCLRCIKDIP